MPVCSNENTFLILYTNRALHLHQESMWDFAKAFKWKVRLTSTCPEIEAAFATDVVKTLSAEAPTLATVTVVTSET